MSGKLSPARAVQIGVLLELVGVALFASDQVGWGPLAPCLFIYGVGIGLATAQLTGVIMVDVPMDKIGQGSGSQSTVRQIGSALGIAVLGTVLFTQLQASLLAKLAALGTPQGIADGFAKSVVESAGGNIPGMVAGGVPESFIQASKDAFTDGTKWSALAAGIFLLLGFAATFRLSSGKHGESLKK
jgi:hypothetical protein